MSSSQMDTFRDLGKATRRGIRKCHKCGTVTGTRGRSCKNPSCDVVFREDLASKKRKTDDSTCRICLRSQHCRVFSVRTYHRGPDYRTFVQLPMHQANICTAAATATTTMLITVGSKCYLEGCTGSKFPCMHIKAAEECTKEAERITIKESVMSTISIPTEAKQVLASLVCQTPHLIVQRCSPQSFVVNCCLADQPFGCCHMLFFKLQKEDENKEQRFLCSCQPAKMARRSTISLSDASYDSTNKYCIHYYACVYAFASNEHLSAEFDSFLSRAFEVYPATILSQLHLTLVARNNPENEEGGALERPSQISVAIMRENLSLLESIAAVDDTSSEIQSVSCTLAEHSRITTTEDALNFGDSTTLDSLDENDPNCTTHLTHISEILNPSTQNPDTEGCEILDSSKIQPEKQPIIESPASSPNDQNTSDSGKLTSPKAVRRKLTNSKGLIGSDLSDSSQASTQLCSGGSSEESEDLERKMADANYERWLSSIIERINAGINYGLPETCSIVDYVPNELFERLKDQITSTCKKKCQIVTFVRKHRPPTGTFRKQVWNVFSLLQLLSIFHSSKVELKSSAFYIQTSNGLYSEWTSSNEDEKHRKQQLLPVLHFSKLKTGKGKQLAPFVIEWIPDIFQHSSMGELSLSFQVTHVGPIQTEEERKACLSGTQRFVQSASSKT